MRFKVGDRVVLRKSSKFYGGEDQLNDEVGVILAVDADWCDYCVDIPGKEARYYNDDDLDSAKTYYLNKFKQLI